MSLPREPLTSRFHAPHVEGIACIQSEDVVPLTVDPANQPCVFAVVQEFDGRSPVDAAAGLDDSLDRDCLAIFSKFSCQRGQIWRVASHCPRILIAA
jgi:hypothetical protein